MFLALSNSIANHRFPGAAFVGPLDAYTWYWEDSIVMEWESGISILAE